ncbi:hypothetical protein [Pseudomonas citronellolis]|uniref:hypothetical protein n=1 Tax=Pseudomonas citronellolis TaxID=53408 RepID=UPI0023E3E410|nr:hypothetical protein [Pseudomonas citronellolis]MDF3932061.1 hypothetical protein [Pseudomonas citronellolis]
MLRRCLLLTLLPLLLSACGDADKAPPTKPATTAPAPVAAAPATPVEAPKPAEPPKPVATAPAKPAASKAALGKPLAPEHLPVADAKPKKAAEPEPSVNKPLPHAKLDLRLPKDVLHGLEPGSALREDTDKPLLPPMFEEKESPFQVGGRLIQRERGERADPNDDSWHSDIRGAELQFQFRN